MAFLDVLNSFLGNDDLICCEMFTHAFVFFFIEITYYVHAHILCFL